MKSKIGLLTTVLFFIAGITAVVYQGAYRGVREGGASALVYTLVGTHPQAAAQPTSTGKVLAKLIAYNGKIYSGYGDYTANNGPIYLNPFNTVTGTFTGSLFKSPTEAILNFRIINGKLYAPDIDPIAGESSGGYAVGEPWSHKSTANVIHMYDVISLTGSDLWMVGAQGSKATAWRSLDGGVTWAVVQSEAADANDYARYYWAGVLNGKLYLQAKMLYNGVYRPVKIFDGANWTTGMTTSVTSTMVPVPFNNKLITSRLGLSAFDGNTSTAIDSFKNPAASYARDLYVDGAYLYVLKYSNEVVRTTDLNTWESLGNAPAGATSLAVLNDQLYIGTTASQLYRSSPIGGGAPPPPPADTTKPVVAVTSPLQGATVSATVTVNATASDNVAVSSVTFMADGATISTDTSSPYSASWNSKAVTDGAHALTARAVDAAGNTQTSTAISVTVKNTDTSPTPPTPPSSPGPAAPPASDTTPPPSLPTITPTGSSSSVSGSSQKPALQGEVSIQAPANLTDVQGNTFVIVKAEYYVDGTLIETITQAPFDTKLDTTKLKDGQHTLIIKFYNDKGEVKQTSQTLEVENNKIALRTVISGASIAAIAISLATWGAWHYGFVNRVVQKFSRRGPPSPPDTPFNGVIGQF